MLFFFFFFEKQNVQRRENDNLNVHQSCPHGPHIGEGTVGSIYNGIYKENTEITLSNFIYLFILHIYFILFIKKNKFLRWQLKSFDYSPFSFLPIKFFHILLESIFSILWRVLFINQILNWTDHSVIIWVVEHS